MHGKLPSRAVVLELFSEFRSSFLQSYPDVPNTAIKLLLFPFSLDGVAKTWLDKEPPNSILTWGDLVSKFINFFFPPSKTTNLRNEITNFRQIAQESFSEAWERFKELLRKCPHHGFSLMHQLDTFYNSLSYNDQDSLNSAAGGNFLYKSPTEGLQIIENKAKVRCSRNAVMRVSTNAPPSSSTSSSSNFEFQQMAAALEDKMTLTFRNEMNEMKNMMKALVPTPVPIKAVEERCTTCGSNHSFNVCLMTRGGYEYPVYHDNFQQFQQTASVGNDWALKLIIDRSEVSSYFTKTNQLFKSQPSTSTSMVPTLYQYTFTTQGGEVRVHYDSKRTFLKHQLPQFHHSLDENEPLTERNRGDHGGWKGMSLKDGSQDNESIHMMDAYDDQVKDVCEPESNDDSTTSAIVDEFESLLGDIIKQKEELKGISDPVARRRACFANLDKCKITRRKIYYLRKKASISAISHIFPNNNLEDSFKMGNEGLNFVPNKELDKEILIPIPRESKIGKDCDFPSCDDFQSFKTFSNPLFEKEDDFPSRNDESILKEETLKSYLNPLFEDNEEIISNEVSSKISPKVDVKTIMSFFAPIGNCVRKWALSEVGKDNVEVNHEVFKNDNENSLGIHDNEEEEIAFLDRHRDFENKVEPEKKKELQVFHPDIEILDHLETTSYVGNDYVFYEDFNLVDMIFPMNIQGKIFDPGITFHGKSFEKDVFNDKSSKELAPSKALLTLDVFDPLHPPLMDFHVSDFDAHVHMWKDKQFPTISIDVTQVFYLEDLARQPRGWKVVEHVYHRDVAESDQDVIHGSSSSNVTLSVELTNFEHTDLSINSESTEVDVPVNDDNANANEGNAEDDVVAHVLDDDDDVVVSDDDEVNPSTNVEEMACVFPRSHGGDAGGSPPRQPNRPVPAQCESSNLRIETGNASLRRAFRQNGQRPLTIGFDYGDLGTFHPTGDYSSMLNSLMGETVKYLPLACEWEEIPEAYKAHIFPTLESYFDLASWYNNQDKVVMGNNVYTVGDRVKLGLQLKLRILWRKNKQRIKADHFTRYGSAEEARNHLPPKKVWGDRTEDEWNNLVDWWSHPDRVARSLQNAANRAKNTILTHQGKKSFAQGRNEYKVQKGHYEDLIETWRKTHSRPETGEFKTPKKTERDTLDMKSMQDQVRAGSFPYKTDQDILDKSCSKSGRRWNRILRQRDQEAEFVKEATAGGRKQRQRA
ncbi:reverse transcriptase domain-containing protein [Tanacetum coccineum]